MFEPGEIRICRACMSEITNGNHTEIDENSIKTDLNELISTYLPELEIKVEHPCLCYECFSTLYLFHKFKKRCLQTEEKLRLYVEERPQLDIVDLDDVLTGGDVLVAPPAVLKQTEEIIDEIQFGDNVELFSCKLCEGRSFRRRELLLDHLSEIHNKKKGATCLICYLDFPNNLHLKLHHREHRRRKKFDPTKLEMEQEMVLNCVLCIKSFPNEDTLRDHMQIVHNKKRDTVCLLCLRELKTPKTLATHILQHKGDMKNKCYICGKSFVLLNGLKHHVRVVHEDNASVKRACPQCGRNISFGHFSKHMELHQRVDGPKYVCYLCNWVYASNSGLILHLKNKHHLDKNQTDGNQKIIIQ